MIKRTQSHFRGCLLGGAIGDALGWPVEFMSLSAILEKYGPKGIRTLQSHTTTPVSDTTSDKAQITDDTQMTLFTAEGILRAQTRNFERGIAHHPTLVYFAYQRWLRTQGEPRPKKFADSSTLDFYDGWLLDVRELHARRAPGTTCLSALHSAQQGTIEHPINNSKGCGGVMRVAPAGLYYPHNWAFEMASEFAALTHGHPSGYLSAGALAYLIALLIQGEPLPIAVELTLDKLQEYPNNEECTQRLLQAVDLVKSGLPDVEAIPLLGAGWVGEEALAISVYCALKYPQDFRSALIAAVNHSGDSDSTGAITGNILGTNLGVEAIPAEWLDGIELKDVIIQIADDLLCDYQDGNVGWDRYPGY